MQFLIELSFTTNMNSTEEQILVVPRSLFDRLGSFQGVITNVENYLPELLAPSNTSFMPRSKAEVDPSFKQLIPYSILTANRKILRYFRGSGSGEARLHAKGSIGVGGHINSGDVISSSVDRSVYERAVDREINEELHGLPAFTEKIVALLNDDSNDVGKVHLGVVHHFQLESDSVSAAESALRGLEFVSLEALRKEKDGLETWSQILVDHWESLIPSW